MAIGLTGHKAQGMPIAKDEPLEKAVLHFYTGASRNTVVGLEYVMTGRAKTLPDFAIGNKVAILDGNKLLKIGTSPKGVERHEFQQMVKERYESHARSARSFHSVRHIGMIAKFCKSLVFYV